jgi:cell division protein FtsN
MANKKSIPEKPKKRYHVQFSLTSLFLSGIGGIFILIWVFALGIIVGRGFLNDRMEGFFGSASKTEIDEQASKPDYAPRIKEEELTFYNRLTDTERIVQHNPPAQSPPEKKFKPQQKSAPAQKVQDTNASYSVQVASLNNKGKTKQVVERLRKAGYPAYSSETNINGKAYYRIRCGPFPDADQAERIAARLKEEEGFKPFIVHPHTK